MPFGYFGAKHGLARFYPAPVHDTIIEPFAGAAGYSCHWAKLESVKRVILVEKNPSVVALWKRLKPMNANDFGSMDCPPKGYKTGDPMVAAAMGGEQMMATLRGQKRSVTDRCIKDWDRTIRKFRDFAEIAHKFEVYLGNYADVVHSQPATWFIDPPYQPKEGNGGKSTAGGARYNEHGDFGNVNYEGLAEWCTARKGQVMVCEQMPASWLPFSPFRNQRNGVGAGTASTRTEALWLNNTETT